MYTIRIYTTTRTNTIATMYTTARMYTVKMGCAKQLECIQQDCTQHVHTQYPLGHKVRKGVCREVATWCVKDTREQEKNTRIYLTTAILLLSAFPIRGSHSGFSFSSCFCQLYLPPSLQPQPCPLSPHP